MLYAEVLESSGLNLAHSFSPIVTIAYYEGDSGDVDAPSWTCIPPQKIFEFHQPRHSVAELFLQLGHNQKEYVSCLYFWNLYFIDLPPRLQGCLQSDVLNWALAAQVSDKFCQSDCC
jgi:hypothetical protein